MKQLKKSLEEREKLLLQLKKEKEKALTKAPAGTLRVCTGGNRTQYYHRTDPKDLNGVYIKEKEISAIKKYLSEYPDFTVLNVNERKELYWEHLGMMDDSNYVERALQKIITYEQNGIFPGKNLILTYETKKTPLNQKIVSLIIQQYLK